MAFYKLTTFLLGLTDEFYLGVFAAVIAVWFMAIGYLLVKHATRRARARVVKGASVAASPMMDHEQALIHG